MSELVWWPCMLVSQLRYKYFELNQSRLRMTDIDQTRLYCCTFIHVYRTRLAFYAGVSVNGQAQCKTIHLWHQPVLLHSKCNSTKKKQSKTEQEQMQKQKNSECKHLRYRPVPTFFISPLLLFFQLVSPSSGFTLAQSQQPVWFWKWRASAVPLSWPGINFKFKSHSLGQVSTP